MEVAGRFWKGVFGSLGPIHGLAGITEGALCTGSPFLSHHAWPHSTTEPKARTVPSLVSYPA